MQEKKGVDSKRYGPRNLRKIRTHQGGGLKTYDQQIGEGGREITWFFRMSSISLRTEVGARVQDLFKSLQVLEKNDPREEF